MFEKITQSIIKKAKTHRKLLPFLMLALCVLFGCKAIVQAPQAFGRAMKNRGKSAHHPARRVIAMLLAVSMTLSMNGGFAFAAGKGADGAETAIGTSSVEGFVDSGAHESPNAPTQGGEPTESPNTPTQGGEQSDCTCPPVDSGEVVHGENCPLYEKPVEVPTEAITAVYALIAALPTVDELGKVDTEGEGFAEYLAKLRLDTAAARSAYNALTDEEKASFDPAVLEKLTALEAVLATMPVLMAEEIPVITLSGGTYSYQNVKYTLTTTATVSGVVNKTAVTGVDNVLTIPAKVKTEDGTVFEVTAIGAGAFIGTSQLKAVTVPASVTTIGNTAFDSMAKGAVVTLLHTECPSGIDKASFLIRETSLLFIKATPAVAAAVGDTYDNAYYGIFVNQLPVPDFDKSNGSLKLERSTKGEPVNNLRCETYTVFGIKNESDIKTTYGNGGYATYLSINETNPLKSNSYMVRLPGEAAEAYVKDGIWAKAESEFVAGGKYLRITYTMRNSTNAAISNVSLGVNADVQIDTDDKASIYPTPTGFRMVNTVPSGYIGSGMQFTLNCTDAPGADNVDTMWYGHYTYRDTNLFSDLPDKSDLTNRTDSGLAFSWKGMSIPAGGSISKSVVFGVSEAAAPPALPADGSKPIALYLTTEGQKHITVNAKVTDTAGVTDTLYYTINDGEEKTLGDPVTATGSEQVIAGVIGAENFTADDTYTVKLWIMNSKGAMSEVITKVLTVTSGAMGGAGLEQGGAPTPPPPPATCTCIAPGLPSMFGNQSYEAESFPNGWDFAATGSVVGGSCAVADHQTNQITYTYSFVNSTGGNIPTFDATGFSFPAAGVYTIKCVASANGKETTGTATFTITAPAPKITVTGVCNGDNMNSTGGSSLQDAVTKAVNGLGTLAQVTKITITAGEVTADDWAWFKGGTTNTPVLSNLTHFAIDEGIADNKVAPIPDGAAINNKEYSIFPKTITNVTIPQVITVGVRAFKECILLTTVELPKATSIRKYAFFNCWELASVELPKAISIGTYAFQYCKKLTSVSLPEATNIGECAFQYCEKLASVSLPEATSIETNAFSGCTSLATASFPAARSIESSVFKGCTSLETASFPAALSIEFSAFKGCTSLATASFPVATRIGGKAFEGCTALTTLKLGAKAPREVASDAFLNCTAKDKLLLVGTDGTTELTGETLTNAQVEYDKVTTTGTGTDTGTATDGLWFGWKVREPVTATDNITIMVTVGATTKTVGGASLSDAVSKWGGYYQDIEKLKITEGEVTGEDWKYFVGGTPGNPPASFVSLTTFEVADKVTSVAPIPNGSKDAAIFPSKIQSVIIPQVTTVGKYAFAGCKKLTTVSLPAATSIGDVAFKGCTGLIDVSLPKVTRIGLSMFDGCTDLTTVSLPKATTFSTYAFDGCTKLATLKLGAAVPTPVDAYAFYNCPTKDKLVLVDVDGITELTGKTLTDAQAAYDNVTADGNTTTDGKWYGWKVREPVAATDEITIKVNGGTTEHGGASLQAAVTAAGGASTITKLTITAGKVTETDWKWLKNLNNLTHFAIADAPAVTLVESIPNGSTGTPLFPTNIESVSIPQAITVGDYAFTECKNLTSVSLPKATTIGRNAFFECTALLIVNLDKAISIGISAFNGCTALKNVSLPEAITIGATAFSRCTLLDTVSLPKATSIGESAFFGCKALLTVNLDKATSIGGSAFNGCKALTEVSLPAAITIGTMAFYYCTDLTTISLPVATTIGKQAFENCSNLHTVSLPKATQIGSWAFKDCTKLDTLKLGATVPTSVNATAFNGCTAKDKLVLVDVDGTTELTESTTPKLSVVAAAYDAVNDDAEGYATDGLWFGWKIGGTAAAAEAEWTPTGGNKTTGTLKAALVAVKATGGTITLLTNVEDDKNPLDVPIDGFSKPVTLVLNGKTLNANVSFENLTGLFTIDGTAENSTIKGATAPAITSYHNSNLKLKGGTYIGASDGVESAPAIIMIVKTQAATEKEKLKNLLATGYVYDNNTFEIMTETDMPPMAATKNMVKVVPAAGKITITVSDSTTTKTAGGDTLAKAVEASGLTANKITTLKITAGEVTTADWSLLKTLTKLTDFTIDTAIADGKVAPIPNGSDVTPIFPESIVKATIPQAIAVGDYAFAYCKALTTVELPKATKIGGYAFIFCKALKSVSLPKATSIGELAFQACDALTTVELPEVTSIKQLAFSACKVLASVSLPKVTRIDNYAFKDCPLLTTLKLTATPPTTMGSSVFTDCPTDRSLVLMDANGGALTGSTLTTAQNAYKAANDDNSYDDLWYGWKLGDSGVNVAVTGVTLNKPALSLAAGKSETLVATIAPANASNKAVTWRTSNTGIATVDQSGKVTAVAVGTATITVTTTDGGKTATCAVTVTAAAASKPAPGGVLTAPLTQDKVDDVFGEGNATLDNNAKPPKITIGNDITVEKPIEIETDVTIDLGGNTITGKPGQPPIIVGENDKVTVGGDGTVAGGDNSGGTGGNGITGGTGSDITIGGGVTVEGGDGTTGGDGINSGGNVTVGGDVNGGNGSAGNGGDGVDTSTGGGNITIKPDGSANGGDSTGGNGNGGNGTSSGGNTIVDGDVTGGNGNGSGNGGNGATDTAGGSGSITVQPGGSSTGGNGGSSGGAGGDGVENNGGGSTTVGGDATGGAGGSSSSGTGGAGGNGSASNGGGSIDVGGSSTGGSGGNGATGGAGGSGTATGGDTTISGGGSATGGNGGTGTTGGNGGDGADSGSITVGGGGTASGGNGGTGTATGGNGGDGSDSSGEGTINGGVSGGNGGSGGSTGGSGGNGAASGTGDIDIGGSASGGNGGSGGTTGGTGGNGTTTGGDITVSGGGSSTGGNGGSSSTIGGNGGNGTDTSGGGTTVNGGATGGNGGHGTGSSGSGGTGGNGANQGGGSVNGSGTATGGNGGNGTETGVGGNGGAGVGGGASAGSGLEATDGKNGLKAITKVDDSKAGTTVTVPDKSTLADAALTPAEKKDKDITEVSVTLNIEKKNDQPNKAEVEKVLSSAAADIIGAFFDITLEKIITKGGSAQSPVNVSDASDEIEITITIPSDMRGGSNYMVIRVHNGNGAILETTQDGNNLTFKTDKFSTYAIAYTKQGGTTPPPPSGNNSGGGSSGGSTGNEEAFWKNTAETIGEAKKGDVIKINAGNYDKIPSEVMDILRKNDITVVIEWNNGETITIPAGKAPKAEAGRVFYPLSLLAEMYKNVKFVNTETVVKPQGGNPETGGPGYIEYADGKTTAVTGKVVQAANAPQAENATTANGANSGETVTQKAVTPPTAGFEADAFAGTPDTQQTNDGNAFATITLMLAAAAVGSGVWLWKKKHENEKLSKM